jgi:hypothetical protein
MCRTGHTARGPERVIGDSGDTPIQANLPDVEETRVSIVVDVEQLQLASVAIAHQHVGFVGIAAEIPKPGD